MLKNNHINFILFFLLIIFNSKIIIAQQAYFDISDHEIQIQTNFNGKEVIIFGLTDPKYDTILIIKGPNKNGKLSIKERIFGFWFETNKIIYMNIPSIFFIASSAPINEILNEDIIIKKELLHEDLLKKLVTKRNFIDQKKLHNWDKNLIRIQKNKGLYKNYKLKIVDEKLFQTRVFFPSNSIPGKYYVNILQVKDKKIISEKNKRIIIKKTGIGNKIYQFANNQPGSYGVLSIIFAIISGLAAAAAFRRL